MKLEIKNLKFAEFASEETNCFSATVYVDGVKATMVSNEGRGGPNRWDDHKVAHRISNYAATLPKITTDLSDPNGGNEKFSYAQDADTLIDALVTKALLEKDLRKLLKTRLVYVENGKLMQSKAFKPTEVAKHIGDPANHKKLSAEGCLNILPFAEALALFAAGA